MEAAIRYGCVSDVWPLLDSGLHDNSARAARVCCKILKAFETARLMSDEATRHCV